MVPVAFPLGAWNSGEQEQFPQQGAPAGTSGLQAADTMAARKLRKAAQDFEAILLSAWWQAARQSSFLAGEDQEGPGSDTVREWGMLAFCSAVASAGGLGIARMIVRQLAPGPAAADGNSGP